MAVEIRREHVFLASQALLRSLRLRPVGHNWLTRFKQRNPEISDIWTRQITSLRYKAATQEIIQPWFNAIAEMFSEHRYPSEHRYNMNESKFVVGTSQSSKALVNICEK